MNEFHRWLDAFAIALAIVALLGIFLLVAGAREIPR